MDERPRLRVEEARLLALAVVNGGVGFEQTAQRDELLPAQVARVARDAAPEQDFAPSFGQLEGAVVLG